MRLSAVIGASYGDEGKGHTVDHLAVTGGDTLVVRFNGGAQAGHTVVNGGRRHVFHHLGAGTLRGAPTFLSPHFILNPILFREEHALFPRAQVYVDPACPVTTPFDMMLNQAAEARRGTGRHGSCGLGINETVTRTLAAGGAGDFRLLLGDAGREQVLREKLVAIRDDWVPRRAEALGLDLAALPWLGVDRILDRFVEDVSYLRAHVHRRDWAEAMQGELRRFEHVVFEGAQGLRLDEESPEFPHVTRSRTGLTNVLRLVDAACLAGPLEVYYATRPYLTRHGAGSLAGEVGRPPFPGIVDETNLPNAHQGSLRFALLDPAALTSFIAADLRQAAGRPAIPRLVVTCLDQVPDVFPLADGTAVTGERLARRVAEGARLEGHLLFHGEERAPVSSGAVSRWSRRSPPAAASPARR
jgi:adenylosuccinate synthase